MRLSTTFAVLPLLASGLLGQATHIVSPASFTNKFANSGAPVFTTYAPCTYMQIHRDLGNKALQIKEMSFRRYPYVLPAAAFSASISLSLSTASASAPTATYAKNHGVNKQTIYSTTSPKTFNFPQTVWQKTPVFEYHIPFPSPVTHLYIPKTSLCWEMRVHSSTIKSSFWLDLVNATIELKATPIGKGCIATGQTTEPAIQTTIKEEPAKNRYVLKTLAAALPASQPYLLWFGLRKDFWGTTPLPLELSGYGGPGCSIYVDLTLPLAGTTDAKGTVVQYYTTNPITFPNNPAYQGTPFFLQWWCADPQRSSGLKVVFSQGQELSVPGNSAVARIYTSQNAAATTGTVEPGSGIITRFRY
jgi:hypothetical protein